jgi:hypothetical protein
MSRSEVKPFVQAQSLLRAEQSTAPDRLQPALVPRFGFRRQVSASVRPCGQKANPHDRGAAQPPPLACHTPRILMRHVDHRDIFL